MSTNLKRSVSFVAKQRANNKRGRRLLAIHAAKIRKTAEEMERYSIRRGLMNGYVDDEIYNYSLEALIDKEKIEVGYEHIRHHPIISTICEDIMGAERRIPFVASIKSATRDINDAKLQELDDRLQQNFIKVVTGSFLKKGQLQAIEDKLNYGLIDPEEAQFQADLVDTDIENLDIEGITKEVDENFKLPVEIQAQKVLNLLIQSCDVRKVKTETMEDLIPTYEMYIHVGMNRGEPVFERMSPEDFAYIPSPHSPKVEDATAGVWTQRVSLQQAFQMDGEHFTPADVKKLEKMVTPISDIATPIQYTINERPVRKIEKEIMEYIDTSQLDSTSTQKGQEQWKNLIARFSPHVNINEETLLRKYIAYRDFVKYKEVTRVVDGKEKKFIMSEHYTFNPDIDIDIKTIEYTSIYHGIQYEGITGESSIATGEIDIDNVVQIKVEEIKYPKTDKLRPWAKQLPFFGGKLNTRNGKAKNKSLIDNAITDQYDYDLFSEMLKKTQATNYGKVMSFIKEYKPDDVSWKEFFSMMKNMHLIMIDPYKEEFNIPGALQNAMQAYKELDLSNNSDMVEIINKLIYHEQRISRIMLFNSEASGMISPYAKTANVAAALSSTQSRLSNLFEKQTQVIENALQYLFNMAIQYYYDNQDEISYAFKSASVMFGQLNWSSLLAEDLGIKIVTNTEETAKVEVIQAQLLSIIQNQLVDYSGMIDTIDAKTMEDLRKIAIELDARMVKRQEADRQAFIQQKQFEAQQDEAKFKREADLKIGIAKMNNDADLQMAQINSYNLARQFDINKDGQNDMVQLQETKNAIRLKEIENDRVRILEEIKLKKRAIDLKERELMLKYKKATA